MPSTSEETRRIHLGSITLVSSPPVGVPAAGSGIVENVYPFTIGPGINPAQLHRHRFNTLEVVITFGGDRTEGDVIPYYSRINPAPNDYSPVVDGPDTWGSAGGQRVYLTPSLAGGNIVEINPRGAKWIALVAANLNGASGELEARLYGIMSAVGGLGF